MFEKQFLQPEEIEGEEEKPLDINEELRKLREMGVQIPEDLSTKIRELEKMKKQQVPDWLKKEVEEKHREIEDEISLNLVSFRTRFLMGKERREKLAEKFDKESLEKIDFLGERAKEVIERHLLMAENEEDAKRILGLWEEFLTKANISLYGDGAQGLGARGKKQVETRLERAIDFNG